MIGSGTPSIQSNMPRPIGSLLLRFLSRDLQTDSMSISSYENSKNSLVLLRFDDAWPPTRGLSKTSTR